MKRDLRLMLLAARQAGIPLLLGSARTAGGISHVAVVKALLTEIAAEAGLSFSLALIQAEQDKTYLKQRLREGRIKPLKPAPSFDEVVIDRSTRIVGMMGSEPYPRALDNGAEVVLAGRSIDTEIFAGIPAGIAWHVAKLLECGAASAEQRTSPDCLMATCRADHVDVEPRDPTLRCTPQSIASHSRHENADSCTSASTSRSSTSELISWGCATSFGQWRSWDRAMYVCSTTCWAPTYRSQSVSIRYR
jgi:hypothetical protein